MKKLSGILSTLFLSITAIGLFSATLAVGNSSKDTGSIQINEPKKAEAVLTNEYPSDIYIGITSTWINNKGGSLSNFNITLKGGGTPYSSLNNVEKQIKNLNNFISDDDYKVEILENSTTKRGFDILHIRNNPLSTITSFRIHDNSSSTGKANYSQEISIQQSPGGKLNLFIINTYHFGALSPDANEHGQWTYFDTLSTIDNTRTLYVSPCFKWLITGDGDWPGDSGYWEFEGCWPYLNYKNTGDANFTGRVAAGILRNDGRSTTASSKDNDRQGFVFYFPNVPYGNISSMTVYFGINSSPYNGADTNKFSISSTNLTKWNSTSDYYNFFSTSYGTNPSTVYGYMYSTGDSRTFITGSFTNYSISIPSSTPAVNFSNDTITNNPTLNSSLAPVVEDNQFKNQYKLTLSVNTDNYFKYHTYNYMYNSATDKKGYYDKMSYYTESGGSYTASIKTNNYSTSNILVYDGDTLIPSSDWSSGNYIASDASNNIVFKRKAIVDLVRDNPGTVDDVIKIIFNAEEPVYALDTIFDGTTSSHMNFVYNTTTSRYETVVAAMGLDQYSYYKNDSSRYPITVGNMVNTESISISISNSVVTLPSNVKYYLIGWYPSYNGTDRNIKTFIESYTSYTTEACIVGLVHLIEQMHTCTLTSERASDLKDLYDLCDYNSSSTDKENYLKSSSATFADYTYSDYFDAGYDYSQITVGKRYSDVNALYKYQYIQWKFNSSGSRPTAPAPTNYLNRINGSAVYQESSMIIVIIVSSLSGLAIVGLGIINFVVIKKKKKVD